ncbi:MAG: ferritin-like domain-containing protein [Myxococcales bacterium]|nr:ferritin-like domain-containing protein [Myxococcales bacterium]
MSFPPYRLLDRDHIAKTQAKFERLERLYHVGQQKAWDGKQVLADLLKKHGGIRIPDAKRIAIGEVFSVILWGELAAWSIACDLALMLEEPGAKMAATSQAHDEARHFYVMRDYLLELGGKIPPLDGYTATVLNDLLDTRRLSDKLLGMQLIVETTALTLFRAVAQARVEPVLSDLMPYYERDEARHVGLGVLYLPTVLKGADRLETARLRLFQLKLITMIGWGTHLKQRYFKDLGIDHAEAMRYGNRMVQEAFEGMRSSEGGQPRAVLASSAMMQRINEKAMEVFFPSQEAPQPAWQRAVVGFCGQLARVGDVALRMAA